MVCVLGVFLGVLALTVIMAVSNGFETALVDSILETSGHIAISSPQHVIRRWQALCDDLRSKYGARAVSPCILGQCILEYGQAFSGVNLRGIRCADEQTVSSMGSRMTSGTFSFVGSNEAIIGAPLASQLGVEVGSSLKVVCPDGEAYDVRLVGTFDTGVTQFDLQTLFVPLRLAQRALGFGEGVSHVLMKIEEPLLASEVAHEIASETGLMAQSWLESNKTLLSALSMEKRVMVLVLVLTLVVAGFGIANVLTMAVYEKFRDIGILRAIGASRRMIMGIFVVQGAMVGVIGAVLGTLGGLLTGWFLGRFPIALPGSIYYVDTVPIEFHSVDFLLVAATACIVATVAGVIPARRAVGVQPWEAIRHYQ